MKTVILMRHSAVQKIPNIDPNDTPLTLNGESLAQRMFIHKDLLSVRSVYTSPYKRAYDTARMSGRQVYADDRLIERVVGQPTESDADDWALQYEDHDFKYQDGESLNEVKARMTSFTNELLDKLKDGETAAVVSHATAICAYLLNFCSITVTDPRLKTREITFGDRVILSGKLRTPCAFIMEWQDNILQTVRYL